MIYYRKWDVTFSPLVSAGTNGPRSQRGRSEPKAQIQE